MTCKFCGKPVVLMPSAAHRARKYGETAAYYTSLFPHHAACDVAARSASAIETMKRITGL